MNISRNINEAINTQINRELFSSYLYLQMAAFFKNRQLDGFAHWLKLQVDEERGHAMKLYNYVLERGGEVSLQAIETPGSNWKSPLAIFEAVYEHEKLITAMIYTLMEKARAEKDYATEELLAWFVKEQVEEEANSSSILEKLKLIKDSTGGLFQLDHILGKRS